MSVYSKISAVRTALLKRDITKSKTGYNYNYIDLPQLEPAITEECANVKILPLITFSDNMATLRIIDLEKQENSEGEVDITVPCNPSMVHINDKMPIQNVGGMITYMRRYLYMAAFAISEHDSVEEIGSQKKAVEEAAEIGKQAAIKYTEAEKAERCSIIDELLEIEPQAIEKLIAYKKVSSVDELQTEYLRHVLNAKKKTGDK